MRTRANLHSLRSKFSGLFGDGPTGHEVITGLLSTVYKMDKAAIDEILKEGSTPETILSAITEADKARIKKLNEQSGKDKFQEGYKKAKAEVLTAAETALKEQYGIESDKTGSELVEEIVAAKLKEGGATTEESIKKSPTYKALEAQVKKDLLAQKTESEKTINELKAGYAKEKAFETVGKTGLALLTSLNPVLPSNAVVAETYRTDYINELKGYEYEPVGNTFKVLKDGVPLKDEHGNEIMLEDHAKAVASKRFEFAANNGGANADPAKPDPAKPAGAGTPVAYPAGVTKPKNETELSKIMAGNLKPAEKRIVMDEYKKEFAKPA